MNFSLRFLGFLLVSSIVVPAHGQVSRPSKETDGPSSLRFSTTEVLLGLGVGGALLVTAHEIDKEKEKEKKAAEEKAKNRPSSHLGKRSPEKLGIPAKGNLAMLERVLGKLADRKISLLDPDLTKSQKRILTEEIEELEKRLLLIAKTDPEIAAALKSTLSAADDPMAKVIQAAEVNQKVKIDSILSPERQKQVQALAKGTAVVMLAVGSLISVYRIVKDSNNEIQSAVLLAKLEVPLEAPGPKVKPEILDEKPGQPQKSH